MSYNQPLRLNLTPVHQQLNIISATQINNMDFCTTCNMYNCYHLNPVTPHVYHHANCGCMMRNAGTYTK
jgi:hypothetical protein